MYLKKKIHLVKLIKTKREIYFWAEIIIGVNIFESSVTAPKVGSAIVSISTNWYAP